jgi:uncharacterized protein with HEPN domain
VRDDSVYLAHILECIRRVEDNTAGGQEHFMASHTLQDAVLRNLQTLAEAAQRLSDSVKAKRADIDWRRIVAFRNVLVHDYLGIDMERIWQIVQDDVPRLKSAVISLIQEMPPGSSPSV